jgi:hypothetical protein
MGKMSKAAKADAYDALEADRDLLREVMWHVFNGNVPDAVESVVEPDDGGWYEFRLYGVRRARGGVLVQLFHHGGQSSHVDVKTFDDALRWAKDLPFGVGINTEVKIVFERLEAARRRNLDQQREALHV